MAKRMTGQRRQQARTLVLDASTMWLVKDTECPKG